VSFAFNQKFFEQFLPYFLFEKLASAGRQDFVALLNRAGRISRHGFVFSAGIRSDAASLRLQLARFSAILQEIIL